MNSMHVEDFVVLGRTVPEDSKKYGQRVCMAGYSRACNQFLRVYPLMVPVGINVGTNNFKARHAYTMDLIRNPNDTRMESWRVADEKQPTSTPWNAAVEVGKPKILEWLRNKSVQSISSLNTCKLSLGVLHVPHDKWRGEVVERNDANPPDHHGSLFDDLADQSIAEPEVGRVRFAPYLRFQDSLGEHRLQVREWGAYQLLADPKYAGKPESLWGASGYRRGKDLWIVIGNMTNHRTNWMVIKTFEDNAVSGPGLFDDPSLEMHD